MQGYQLTFFTQQERTHQQQPLARWRVEQARQLGLRGATLQGGQVYYTRVAAEFGTLGGDIAAGR